MFKVETEKNREKEKMKWKGMVLSFFSTPNSHQIQSLGITETKRKNSAQQSFGLWDFKSFVCFLFLFALLGTFRGWGSRVDTGYVDC